MSDVKVEIDRSSTDGTFTNHDIIRGKVTLVVTKAITLNWIQVKLEGISSTQLNIPRQQANGKRDKDRKDKIIRDQHKVLYDTQIVFPPDNVRQVSQAKDFTLAPGNYSYAFEFKIPLNNSCVKMGGITNKVSLNLKSFDVMINNGNFNTTFVKNKAQQMANEHGFANGGGAQGKRKGSHTPPPPKQSYHITSQLPPSLSGIGEFANVKYFIKVTCKRSSFLKSNLRGYDPFIFLPLDLDVQNRPLLGNQQFELEYKEAFVRKELTFRNRIPEIVAVKVAESPQKSLEKKALPVVPPPPQSHQPPKKQGFMSRLFGGSDSPSLSSSSSSSNVAPNYPNRVNHQQPRRRNNVPEIKAKDVPFSFEIRFRYPAFLIPTKPPSFKLYLISNLNPSRYTLAEYGRPDESNGLGIIYLQKLTVKLTSITLVSVVENDGASNEYHLGQHEEVMTVCNNTYQNLKFDLMHGRVNPNASNSSTSPQSSTNIHAPGGSVYEIEIPRKYFDNCILPDHLSPSFKTCNITRKYILSVIGGFSCEQINDFRDKRECAKKIKYVDLICDNIKVLSGLNMTSTLQSNASRSSIPLNNSVPHSHSASKISTPTPHPPHPPPPPTLPPKNSERSYSHSSITPTSNGHPGYSVEPVPGSSHNGGDVEDNGALAAATAAMLPTYEDVVLESSYQDDSEHQRARRRYHQHEQYYSNPE
ncbi:unnamed protein product [Candida parapsilosis]|uniref:Arrestin_N domain-containing protein n=2 Tax=Candida parapsilosis TaxID=5480 RepID=G8BKM9_CANPC|nr:uncharacterized protein CPAR2_703080 [Candida parapsilosis]KAF6042407.1 Arrestin (or S-antigen), N-terminal domain family protein [Candida parapsilosis]KAF6042852.1 Arrestin (or S-antigen), N-terminal domain family protein [Candida parapsilosis]KAI5903232.1 hypothetical protein K4G60_g2387 [Candida parapsilosis]KAI5910262.1 hypothetical protein K4G61_g3961 [Candida parapsilosis]CAD1812822.1 unnamed protein product [Candida parapsilosis]